MKPRRGENGGASSGITTKQVFIKRRKSEGSFGLIRNAIAASSPLPKTQRRHLPFELQLQFLGIKEMIVLESVAALFLNGVHNTLGTLPLFLPIEIVSNNQGFSV